MAIDRSTPTARRAALVQQLDLIRQSLEDAALAQETTPNKETQAQLSSLQADDTRAQTAIAMHDLARQAAGRKATAIELTARDAHIREFRAQVETLSNQMAALLPSMVKRLEGIGPDLAKYITLASRRQNAVFAAIRLVDGADRRRRERMPIGQTDGHATLAAALREGVWASGIGQCGPSLAPYVCVSTPGPAFRVELNLDRELARDHEWLLELIDRAAPAAQHEEALA